jgi:hypothetical protein
MISNQRDAHFGMNVQLIAPETKHVRSDQSYLIQRQKQLPSPGFSIKPKSPNYLLSTRIEQTFFIIVPANSARSSLAGG